MRLRASLSFHESDQEAGLVAKGLNFDPRNLEKPADEMARLIRVIAGRASAGEKDEQLRARAARRLGVSQSRAKVLWYGETENIRADEMDRARTLAFVQPIEEAINVLQAARRHINHQLERLLDEALGDSPDAAVDRRRLVDRRRHSAADSGLMAAQPRLMHSK